MKTKALILIGLSALSLMTRNAPATNPNAAPVRHAEMSIPHSYEEIELRGALATNAGPNAIEAGANDSDIYIGFNESFGNVNISIYNSIGSLVYSTVVNTNVQQVYIIPFAGVASGTYTVELSNANGYVEGEFEHEQP